MEFVTYPDDTPADQTDNPRVQYHYDDAQIDSVTLERLYPHALTGISDENGDRFATWTYNAGGLASSSEHSGGVEQVTFEYDLDQTTVTNANGKQTIYHFDIVGQRQSESGIKRVGSVEGVSTSNCLASNTSYTYDPITGFKNKETDSEGNITTFVMNALGEEISRTEAQIDVAGSVVATADTRTIETDWDAFWKIPSEMRVPGKTTTYTYENNRVKTKTEIDTTSSTVPYSTNGTTRTWTYNYTYFGAGQQQVETISIDGPRTDVSDVTVQTFNPQGWLLQSQNALGHTTQILTHNTEGLPLTLQDPNGTQISLTYTPRNWLDTQTVHSSDGNIVVDYDYDEVGQVTRVTMPNGVEVNYDYDAAHRLIEIYNTDEGGVKFERIEYVLDDLGNTVNESIYSSSNTLVYQQQKVFDDLGRLLTVIGAEGQDLRANSYGPNGNLERVTDPNALDIVDSFDGLNRLHQTEDRNGNVIVVEHDAQDNVISVTDQKLLTTSYVYDGLGRKIQQSSPDTGVTTYYYDLADNLTQTIDARSIEVNYTYDALNRLLTTVYPGSNGENLTYRYDELTIQGETNKSIGRLTGIDQNNGNSIEYLYDDLGNTTKVFEAIDRQSFVTGYAYDEAGLLEQVLYPSGRLVNYAYDNLGRVNSVSSQASATSASETLASGIDYKAFGPVSQLTFGNGVQMNRSYDLHYRPDAFSATDGGTDLMAYDFGFSARNYIDTIVDLVNISEGQSFLFDAVGQLEHAEGAYGVLDYGYDPVGNREFRGLTGTSDNFSEAYSYPTDSHKLDQIVRTGFDAQVLNYAYTPSGNTQTDTEFEYVYDDTNRLVTVLKAGELIAQYDFNALGQRTSKTVASTTTYFHYDLSGRMIAESNPDGSGKRDFIYLGDMPLAMMDVDSNVAPTCFIATAADGTYQAAFLPLLRHFRDNTLLPSELGSRFVQQYYRYSPAAAQWLSKDEMAQSAVRTVLLPVYATAWLAQEPIETQLLFFLGFLISAFLWKVRLKAKATVASGLLLCSSNLWATTVDNSVQTNAVQTNSVEATTWINSLLQLDFADWAPLLFIACIMIHIALFYRDYSWAKLKKGITGFTLICFGLSTTLSAAQAETYYFHTDHLNTPKVLTDSSKQVVWRGVAKPFGETDTVVNAVDNPLRFPGQYFDPETGLHYNYMRDYDPMLGRYLQADRLGMIDGPNIYGYALANPIMYTDPNGEFVIVLPWLLPWIWGGITIGWFDLLMGTSLALILLTSGSQHCESEEKECDITHAGETYYEGDTKTCVYREKGGIFTFPQDKELTCMPINMERCFVDTSFMGPKAREAYGGQR